MVFRIAYSQGQFGTMLVIHNNFSGVAMQYTYLGRSGLRVSRLCLGTMNFGMVTDEAESFRIMDKAFASGINLFDTADVYGGPQSPDIPARCYHS